MNQVSTDRKVTPIAAYRDRNGCLSRENRHSISKQPLNIVGPVVSFFPVCVNLQNTEGEIVGVPKGKDGAPVPYTMIPNQVVRSANLDTFDKAVYLAIASCDPSFPSYERIQQWTGMSRGRLWKSLRKMESVNLIWRFRQGRSIRYVTWFDISSCDELLLRGRVHFVNSTSSPGELEPVHLVNSNNNKEKELLKSDEIVEHGDQTSERILTFAEVIEMAKHRAPRLVG